jgi:hypothetical protein
MASEVSIRVRATNEANAALRDAARDTRLLNASVEDLQGSMRTYDERARAARDNLGRLDTVVKQHKDSLRQLAAEYTNAGDASRQLDIGKQIDKIESDLRRAMSTRRIHLDELIEISEDSDVAGRLLRNIENGVQRDGSKFAALGAKVGGVFGESLGASAGAAAAPLLIQVLGGAISAGAGALGIGAGIALAIKSDTALQQAGKDLGKDFFGQITQSAHTAFAEPIAREFKVLGRYGDTIADQWGTAFEKLAPAVEPFISSIADTLTDLSGEIADIAGDSGPALEALADGFSDIGDSLTGLLHNLTGSAQENADALTEFTTVVSATIDVVSALTTVVQTLLIPFEGIYDIFYGAGYAIGWVAKQFGAGGDAAHGFRAVQLETNDAMTAGADAANSEKSALQGLADELKAQTDPAFALIAAQKELADAQGAYNKAVKKGGKDSADAKDALTDLAKAAISVEGAAEKASGTFNGKVSPALRATLRAAGLTDAQIDGVASSFKAAKKAGDDFAGKYKAEVGQHGAEAAKRAIAQAAAAARAYAGQYVAALAVKVSRIDAGHDGPQAKATGGNVGTAATGATSSGMTWVGEQGPELVSLQPGTRVMSAVDSARETGNASMSQIAERWRAQRGLNNRNRFDTRSSSGSNISIKIDRHTLAEIMVPAIQDFVQTRAGGNVNVLAGGY